jgi:hypothetical protein
MERDQNTRRDYAAIRGIALNISRDGLDRRIKAFNDHFKVAPTVHRQALCQGDTNASAEVSSASF